MSGDAIVKEAQDQERFWAKVNKDAPDGCWPWVASLWTGPGMGYGCFRYRGRAVLAHRLAYEWLVGPIPDGLQIDHLCRNRACVNPAHLEAVSCRENLLRGIGPTATNAAKTHCPQGHVHSPENQSKYHKHRTCRTCYEEKSKLRGQAYLEQHRARINQAFRDRRKRLKEQASIA